MKRSRLRVDPSKVRAWQQRSRKPLPARSQKRQAISGERREFVAAVLHDRPWCEACPTLQPDQPRRRSVDVHELVRRSQGSPIVPSQGLTVDDVLAVCRECHAFITDHPADAVRHGLARWGTRR